MLTTLAVGINIQRNASVEPLPPVPTYGSQYPVEDSYHICHHNWTENKTRDELQNEQEKNIGLSRLTPIFSSEI